MPELYLQRDQPPGVPPLQLTGERTLPDVPEENYWFRRHLVVYEWIASRVGGRRVVDLACGEGYGSAVLARTAVSVVGVDANPDAFEHARLKYSGPKLRFERNMIELWEGDVDCVVFLQTIEHVQDPDAVLDRIRELIGRDGVAYVSTPNVLTLAPEGEERSGNPWHVKEYRAEEFRALCERHFGSVELLGLFHARKLRAHQVAIERLGWDSIHAALRITKPFYDRFTPAISVRDFALRPARSRPRAGLRRGPAAVSGRLSIVLHTHMPYVEGFGTWPFGEEWLWEAMATSYLPLLDVLDAAPGPRDAVAHAGAVRPARGAGGARALPRASCASCGPRRTAATPPRRRIPRSRASSSAPPALYAAAADRFEARGGDLVGAFAPHAAWTSSATHAVLPLLATAAGVRLQLEAGIASHRRRFGHWARRAVAAGVRARAVARPAARGGRASTPPASTSPTCSATATRAQLRPLRSGAGPLLVPIDRALMDLVWHTSGYPSRRRLPQHAPLHRAPPHAVGGRRRRPTTPRARPSRSARTRATFVDRGGAPARGRRARGLRARHRAARALLARGRRLAGRGRSRPATRPGSSWRGLDAALAEAETVAGAGRAARHELGRAARPRDLERAAGGRAGVAGARGRAARARRAGQPAPGAAGAARAARAAGLRLGLRRHARDGRSVLAGAGRRARRRARASARRSRRNRPFAAQPCTITRPVEPST